MVIVLSDSVFSHAGPICVLWIRLATAGSIRVIPIGRVAVSRAAHNVWLIECIEVLRYLVCETDVGPSSSLDGNSYGGDSSSDIAFLPFVVRQDADKPIGPLVISSPSYVIAVGLMVDTFYLSGNWRVIAGINSCRTATDYADFITAIVRPGRTTWTTNHLSLLFQVEVGRNVAKIGFADVWPGSSIQI